MEWQKNESVLLTWLEAKKFFVLPTAGQLLIAFNEKTDGFKNCLYWTREEKTENDSAHFVDFYKGMTSYCSKESKLFVKLIKKP